MKRIIASTLAAAGLLTAGLALAAGADLSVKGKLQSGACNVAIGGGSAFDLGLVRGALLNSDRPTNFGVPELPINVTCKTPTRFGLRLQDNRTGTSFDGSLTPAGGNPFSAYGLGMSGGKKIGEFESVIYEVTSNGLPVIILQRLPPLELWIPNTVGGGAGWMTEPEHLLSFAMPGESEPAAFEQISALLHGQIYIDRSDELDLGREIQLDGSATLELVYL